jgi:hypothetical protein
MDDVFAQQEAIARRRKLLESVLSQSMQAPIVGNTGLGQALAKLGTAWIAGRANSKLDKENSAAQQEYSKQLADGMKYMLSTAKGGDRYGAGGMGPPELVEPDMLGAASQGMASRFPELQKLGTAMLPNAFPKPPEPETFGQPMPTQGPDGQLGFTQFGNRGGMRPVQGVQPPPQFASEGGMVWDKNRGVGTGQYVGPQYGQVEQLGGAYVQPQKGSGRVTEVVGRPPQTTVINQGPAQGESEFAKVFGREQAAGLIKIRDDANAAYQSLSTVSQMRELDSKGTFEGAAAPAAVFAGQLATSFGIPLSRDTQGRIVNTEGLQQQVAKQVADFLTSGNALQVSDADRAAFERSVASMMNTKAGREQIYSQMEEVAKRKITRFQGAQQRLEENFPQFKGMLTLNQVDRTGETGGLNPALPGVAPGQPTGAPAAPIIKRW